MSESATLSKSSVTVASASGNRSFPCWWSRFSKIRAAARASRSPKSSTVPRKSTASAEILLYAPLTALLILAAAVFPSSVLMQLNLELVPELPWSVMIGALYLTLLWRYVGGWGPPAATAARRRSYRRFLAVPVDGRLWTWLSGAGLAVTILSYATIKLLTETGGVQQTAMIEAIRMVMRGQHYIGFWCAAKSCAPKNLRRRRRDSVPARRATLMPVRRALIGMPDTQRGRLGVGPARDLDRQRQAAGTEPCW